MRLVLVGPSWPFRGGIARTTTALAHALWERGSLAAFLTPVRQYPGWLYPGEADQDEKACPKLAIAERCFSLFGPGSWRRLAQRLAGTGADALVVPFWTAAWVPLTLYLTRQRLPVFGVVHNPHDHQASPWSRWLAWYALRRFAGFFVHSKSVAWHLRRWFGDKPVGVHPLPPPPAHPVPKEHARRELGLPAEGTVFLFFGLVRSYKGVDVLLQAASRIRKKEAWQVVVAGEVWEGNRRLETLVARPELASRVVFRPSWVPESQAPLWFSAADVVVLPYRQATGSAVAAQALAYGLPLVATAVGGLPEVVEEGKNGLLVAPGDAGALAAAMERLLKPEVRARLAAGATAAAFRWTWDSYARCLEELIARGLCESA